MGHSEYLQQSQHLQKQIFFLIGLAMAYVIGFILLGIIFCECVFDNNLFENVIIDNLKNGFEYEFKNENSFATGRRWEATSSYDCEYGELVYLINSGEGLSENLDLKYIGCWM